MAPSVLDGSFLSLAHPCLILANACSMGLRSGEYGGRYQSLAPAALIICLMAVDL